MLAVVVIKVELEHGIGEVTHEVEERSFLPTFSAVHNRVRYYSFLWIAEEVLFGLGKTIFFVEQLLLVAVRLFRSPKSFAADFHLPLLLKYEKDVAVQQMHGMSVVRG